MPYDLYLSRVRVELQVPAVHPDRRLRDVVRLDERKVERPDPLVLRDREPANFIYLYVYIKPHSQKIVSFWSFQRLLRPPIKRWQIESTPH